MMASFNMEEFYENMKRECYQPLIEKGGFQEVLVLPGNPNQLVYDFLNRNNLNFYVRADGVDICGSSMVPLNKSSVVDAPALNQKKVEMILDIDFHIPTGEFYLFIKWVGLDHTHNEWKAMSDVSESEFSLRKFMDVVDRSRIKWLTYFDHEGVVRSAATPSSEDSVIYLGTTSAKEKEFDTQPIHDSLPSAVNQDCDMPDEYESTENSDPSIIDLEAESAGEDEEFSEYSGPMDSFDRLIANEYDSDEDDDEDMDSDEDDLDQLMN